MIPLGGEKNLRLVFQPPEGAGVEDPVPVPLELGPVIVVTALGGDPVPPDGLPALHGIDSQTVFFKLVEISLITNDRDLTDR